MVITSSLYAILAYETFHRTLYFRIVGEICNFTVIPQLLPIALFFFKYLFIRLREREGPRGAGTEGEREGQKQTPH